MKQGVEVKVFILSRIREEYYRGHSNIDSVVEGILPRLDLDAEPDAIASSHQGAPG